MLYLILLILVGLNIAPFLLYKVDMWHAQMLWSWATISLAFGWSFFEKRRAVKTKNLPLALLFGWITLCTTYVCYQTIQTGKYNIISFLPYFNFVCILILYNLILSHLNKTNIKTILNWLRYTVIVTLFMCVLQRFSISQFLEIRPDIPILMRAFHNNLVTGFIGNGTHLSGFLACSVPIFFWHGKREDWLALMLMGLVLCHCGTTIGDPSISGFIIAIILFFYFFKNKLSILILGIVIFITASALVIINHPNLFFSFSGRLPVWEYYFELFKKMPITGYGLGSINMIYKHTPFDTRHLHMEFFHFTFELGLIGATLIIYLIKEFLEIKVCSKLELTLKAMVIGFLLSSCFNWPAHLWLPTTWTIFAYAALLYLKKGTKNGKSIQQKRNKR